jgi:hypothetical protein
MGMGTEIHIAGTVISDSGIDGVSYGMLSTEDKIRFHSEWTNVFMQVQRYDLAHWNLLNEIELWEKKIKRKHT